MSKKIVGGQRRSCTICGADFITVISRGNFSPYCSKCMGTRKQRNAYHNSGGTNLERWRRMGVVIKPSLPKEVDP